MGRLLVAIIVVVIGVVIGGWWINNNNENNVLSHIPKSKANQIWGNASKVYSFLISLFIV